MLGKVFAVLVLSAFIFGGAFGNMDAVSQAAFDGAGEAVTLTISLLGVMCLWSGIIRVLDKAGVTQALSKLIEPFLRFLYPKAYKNKSAAISDIAADYSANLLGLGNAALPLGMRAVCSLGKNGLPAPDTANDEMLLFSVLNTTPLQIMPTTLIAMRNAHGSSAPFEVLLPIWICSIATFASGILICKTLAKFCK